MLVRRKCIKRFNISSISNTVGMDTSNVRLHIGGRLHTVGFRSNGDLDQHGSVLGFELARLAIGLLTTDIRDGSGANTAHFETAAGNVNSLCVVASSFRTLMSLSCLHRWMLRFLFSLSLSLLLLQVRKQAVRKYYNYRVPLILVCCCCNHKKSATLRTGATMLCRYAQKMLRWAKRASREVDLLGIGVNLGGHK